MTHHHPRGRAARLPTVLAWLLLGVAAALPAGAAATMATADAERFIRNVAEDALATLDGAQAEAQGVRDLVDRHVAIDFIGRFGLGKHWRQLSGQEQQQFLRLYRDFFLHKYAAILGGYQGRELTVTGAKPAGEQDVLVSTRVRDQSGGELPADWRVRLVDGRPQIVDIVVDGISVAVNQRQEFGAVVERDGVAGLLAILRSRVGG